MIPYARHSRKRTLLDRLSVDAVFAVEAIKRKRNGNLVESSVKIISQSKVIKSSYLHERSADLFFPVLLDNSMTSRRVDVTKNFTMQSASKVLVNMIDTTLSKSLSFTPSAI